MSETNLRLQLPATGEPFQVVSASRPTPGHNEVCVRAKAVGLNPLDWKQQSFGILVDAWPAVLGVDGSGVVESVGDDVGEVKPGDEVFMLCGMDNRASAFQELITVPSYVVAKKPATLSFEDAASLPICFLTGAAAVHVGLGLPLPFTPSTSDNSQKLKSILVLGGSSAVGANAVQLLRKALPSAAILTTSSPVHHAHLINLGATKAFDRSVQDDSTTIHATTPDGEGVDAILDVVGAASNHRDIFSALNPRGPRLYAYVVTGPSAPSVPTNMTAVAVNGRELFSKPGGKHAIPALAKMIENGQYQLPVEVTVVGNGLESIESGLAKLRQGVSGRKFVVTV